MHGYGFNRICYSLLTDHPSLNLSSGHGVFRNYPESWMDYYAENSYEKVDPVCKFALMTNRPFTWDHVEKSPHISQEQRRVMQEAKESNLHSGIAMGIHGVNGEVSGIGLASDTPGNHANKNVIYKVRAIVSQFHLAYTDLLQTDYPVQSIRLTNREREILLWAAEGKSDSVIADILGLSYSTVRFHTNNAYKKLGANERVYAVTKAIRLGLILPSYVSDIPNDVAR